VSAAVVAGQEHPPRDADGIDHQLERLARRLLAEVAGDPVGEARVRRALADARLRLGSATVRAYLPILVERAVRQQLRTVRGGSVLGDLAGPDRLDGGPLRLPAARPAPVQEQP
jgi:hypothetical protein